MKILKSYLLITLLAVFTFVSCTQMNETKNKKESSKSGKMSAAQILVTTDWLAANLKNPNVRIIDRQDTIPKDNFYSQGHIPDSIHMRTNIVKGKKADIKEMLVIKDLIAFSILLVILVIKPTGFFGVAKSTKI